MLKSNTRRSTGASPGWDVHGSVREQLAHEVTALLADEGEQPHGLTPYHPAPEPHRLGADERDPRRAAPRPGRTAAHHGRPHGGPGSLGRVPRPAAPPPRRRGYGHVATGPGQAHRRPAWPGPARGDGRRAPADRPSAGHDRRRIYHERRPRPAPSAAGPAAAQ